MKTKGKKKFIKVIYYTEPYEEVYEIDSNKNINVEKICEEQRNSQIMSKREFQHHDQFREILIDNTWGWNDSVDSDSQFTYENYRVEQVGDEYTPDRILSMDSDGDLIDDYHPEDMNHRGSINNYPF
jgi:predicted nucleotide-binding protein (sugar kinase/HSP70/actin superfamily)